MIEAKRKYRVQMFVALSTYALAVVLSILWLQRNPDAQWRYAVALLPVLPALYIPVAVAGCIRAMDEMQRRIQLEALAFGFSCAAVLSLSLGFLQNAGLRSINWVWVWPLMGVCWGLGLVVARRRYR